MPAEFWLGNPREKRLLTRRRSKKENNIKMEFRVKKM